MKIILKLNIMKEGQPAIMSKTIGHVASDASDEGLLQMAQGFSTIIDNPLKEVHKVTTQVLTPGV